MIKNPADVFASGPAHIVFPDPTTTIKFEDPFGITWIFLGGMWSRYIDVESLSTSMFIGNTLPEVVTAHPAAVKGDLCEVLSEKRIYVNTGGTDPAIPSLIGDWTFLTISVSQYDVIAADISTLNTGLAVSVQTADQLRSDVENPNKVSMVSNRTLIERNIADIKVHTDILNPLVVEVTEATAKDRMQDSMLSSHNLRIDGHAAAIGILKIETHDNNVKIAANSSGLAGVHAQAINNKSAIGVLQTASVRHDNIAIVNTAGIAANLAAIGVLQPSSVPNISLNTTPISARWAAEHIDAVDPHAQYQQETEKGRADGYAPLDSAGVIPTANLPASVLGSRSFKGTWNAATNIPALSDTQDTHILGDYYLVSVTGATDLNGVTSWLVSDKVIKGTNGWEKISGAPGVSSVNSLAGAVVLDTDKIPEGTVNKYHQDIYVGVAADESHMVAHTEAIGSMLFRSDLGATFARQAKSGIGVLSDWFRITPETTDAGTY